MRLFKLSFLVFAVALFSVNAAAQEKADLIKLYNQADQQASEKQYQEAINSFTQVISVAEQLGAEGDDIKQRAEKAIPGLYMGIAAQDLAKFKQSKSIADLDNAIASFEEAQAVANQYNNDNVSQKSTQYIPLLHYNKGVLLFKQQNYAQANAAFDNAIELNGNYAKAYYQKALVFKKTDPNDIDGMLTMLDKAIEVANSANDGRTARLATKKAHDELVFRGAKATEAKRYDQSISLLNRALNYDTESADAHYRLAEVYNKRSNYDKALEHANQALAFENGSRTEKAKIYFELGFAHQFKNNKSQACDAFSNAAVGQFKAPAEHKMEFELKCETANP